MAEQTMCQWATTRLPRILGRSWLQGMAATVGKCKHTSKQTCLTGLIHLSYLTYFNECVSLLCYFLIVLFSYLVIFLLSDFLRGGLPCTVASTEANRLT